MQEDRTLPSVVQNAFLAIADQTTDCFIAVDLDLRILAMNQAAEANLGTPLGDSLGRHVAELFPKGRAPKLIDDFSQVLHHGKPQEFEEVLHVNGTPRIFATSTFPIHDADGATVALGCIARDVSDRLQADAAQRKQKDLSHSVVEGAPVAILMTDKDGQVLFANPACATLFGYPVEELIGSSIELLVPESLRQQHVLLRSAYATAPSSRQAGRGMSLRCRHQDGHFIPVEIGLNHMRCDDGSFRVIATVVDISERKKLERAESLNRVLDRIVRERTEALLAANRALDHLARHDALTGLHNRRAFIERLREEYLRMGRTGECYALVFLDIDYFKAINDTYGHRVGDTALTHVAAIIQDSSRMTDYAARLGGEEFVVLLPNTAEDAMVFAEKVRAAIAQSTIPTVGNVTVSVGVAVADLDDPNEDAALNAADRAMYRAKMSGRNRVVRYTTANPADE